MKKKILLISSTDNYVRNELFKKNIKKNYSVSFIYYSGNIFSKNFNLLKILFLKYDLILILWPLWSSFFIIKLINLFNKKPIIYDAFTLIYEDYLDNYNERSFFIKLFYKNIEKFILKNCDGILTDTELHRKKILNFIKVKKKIEVVEVSQERLKSTLKVNRSSKINLIHAGANRKCHNITKMIYLVNKLPLKLKKKIHFKIVTLDYFNKYKNLIKKLKNENNIKLFNHLKFNEYLKIIKNSDICMGTFGNSDKANNIISNFIVTSSNFGKVIITRNTQAAKYYLKNNKGIILLKKSEYSNFKKFITNYINSINLRKSIAGESKRVFLKNFHAPKNIKKLNIFLNSYLV